MNRSKKFFLQLAAEVVKAVGEPRDKHNVLYTRKAMMRCCISLNLSKAWEGRQPSPELQNIVNKYRGNFNGVSANTKRNLEDEAIDLDNNSWFIGLIIVVKSWQ